MENDQIAVLAVVALLLSVIGLGGLAYTYSDSGQQAIGISQRVSTWRIIDDAVTSAKIADDSVDNVHKAENNSYWTVTLDKEGQYTSSTDPIATFQMPFAATLDEVSASAVTINTTEGDETYVLDLEEDGTTVLDASKVNITASNTPVVGTVSDTPIADNAKMEVTLTLGGTTPELDDVTVMLVFKKAHVAA